MKTCLSIVLIFTIYILFNSVNSSRLSNEQLDLVFKTYDVSSVEELAENFEEKVIGRLLKEIDYDYESLNQFFKKISNGGEFFDLPGDWPPGYPNNVTGICSGYGFQIETHQVETPDGWILGLQHLVNPNVTQTGPTVLYQHGLGSHSVDMNLNPPEESLTMMLATAGYDVWMSNTRGTRFSAKNLNFSPDDKENYWDFSYDEMAAYDVPSNVNYILNYTNKTQISYIGHSQGTTQAFAAFSQNSTLADQINLFVALAPVAYTKNIEGISQIAAKLYLDYVMVSLDIYEVYLGPYPNATAVLLPIVCGDLPHDCVDIIATFAGPSNNYNYTRIGYYLLYIPGRAPIYSFVQYAQGIRKGTFTKYDYGKKANFDIYGTDNAPAYDLTQISPNLNIALFSGSNDYLADPGDVNSLYSLLPNIVYKSVSPTFNHFDFVVSPLASTTIYPEVISLIGNYTN